MGKPGLISQVIETAKFVLLRASKAVPLCS